MEVFLGFDEECTVSKDVLGGILKDSGWNAAVFLFCFVPDAVLKRIGTH